MTIIRNATARTWEPPVLTPLDQAIAKLNYLQRRAEVIGGQAGTEFYWEIGKVLKMLREVKA